MLTLYHAPESRSESIVALLKMMNITDQVQIVPVDIMRQDGSGRRDPNNPHPEGKVPYLTDGTERIRERGAVILYLTDRFPQSGLGRSIDDPQRGDYLSWLSYYQGVIEPVGLLHYLRIDHPALRATFGDYNTMLTRIDDALQDGSFLLGDRFSAADLLCSSPFLFFGDAMPTTDRIADWAARCAGLMPQD